MQNDTVKSIAQKHSVTAAQVLIKWGLQKGLCVCVKSSNASRMAENLKEWWGLDMDDMDQLDALTTEEALGAWRAHYEKRRAGTAAPWGPGPRPPLEDAPLPSPEPAAVPPIEPVPAYESTAAPERAASPEPAAEAEGMETCGVDSSTVAIPAQALDEPAGDPRPSPKRARVDDAPAAAAAEPEPAAAPAPELDAATVKKMTVAKLRAALAERGLDTKGLKAALQARLLEAVAS